METDDLHDEVFATSEDNDYSKPKRYHMVFVCRSREDGTEHTEVSPKVLNDQAVNAITELYRKAENNNWDVISMTSSYDDLVPTFY